MTARYGGAAQAARVLGISRAQLDRKRAAGTFIRDPNSRTLRRPTAQQARDRGWLRLQHLVAPSLFAEKLPAGRWEYDVSRLRRRQAGPDSGPRGGLGSG